MKAKITLILFFFIAQGTFSQSDTVIVDVNDRVSVIVDEGEIDIVNDSTTGEVNYIKVRSHGDESDTTVIEIGSYDIVIQEESIELNRRKFRGSGSSWNELTFWAGLDIGVNGYIMPDGDFTLPRGDEYDFLALNWGNSRTFSINPVEWKVKLYKNYIGITTGLGIEWNNYRLRYLDWKMAFNADSTYGVLDPNKGTNKSKFRLTYINVPLLLEFNTSKYRKHSFHIAAGVVLGWRIGGMYKQRYRNESGKHKDKTYGNFNVQPFRWNAMVRVGYGSLNLFATYSLNPLFVQGTAPELYQFSAGITIVGW